MTVHTGMDGHLHKELQDSVALQMVADRIEKLQSETKAEFLRINDKLDRLRDRQDQRFIDHEREITILQTKAEEAGKRSGMWAGAIISIAVSLAALALRHLFGI